MVASGDLRRLALEGDLWRRGSGAIIRSCFRRAPTCEGRVMGEHSKIQWTDSTFNPWIGCQKVGPGCDHCYAEAMDHRFGGGHWGAGADRKRTSVSNWSQPRLWERHSDKFFAEHGRRRRVFSASLADVFDNAVPHHWRDDFGLWSARARTWIGRSSPSASVMPTACSRRIGPIISGT